MDENVDAGNAIVVKGYSIYGKFETDNLKEDVKLILHSNLDIKSVTGEFEINWKCTLYYTALQGC